MTLNVLVKKVANDFRECMEIMDCKTWKEFVDANDWDSKDIRDEICATVQDIGKDIYTNKRIQWERDGAIWTYGNNDGILIGEQEIPYGTFKKLVIAEIERTED